MELLLQVPNFTSSAEYVSRLGDTGFWRPYVTEVLKRHGLHDGRRDLTAGINATYPTFLCGNAVVKLFGYFRCWRRSHATERAALVLAGADPQLVAPGLLADGELYESDPEAWPYLIITRVPGIASSLAELSAEGRLAIAAQLGEQVRRVHALRPAGAATLENRQPLNVAAAARQSSLPPHLIAQIESYLARLEPFDAVFCHGDLCANHVFVAEGRLTGIIDWGDALVTDRHYEIVQVFRDMFGCDKALLRTFLEAGNWPIDRNFPRQALGLALYRQAVGLAQHRTMDVFEPIAARFPLDDIASLDELATALFAV